MNVFHHIFHRLFGWHYVTMTHGFEAKVRRVKFTPIGEPYVNVWSTTGPTYLEDDGACAGANSYWRWRALTQTSLCKEKLE